MFKNSVFKPSVDTIEWTKKAGVRAVKTVAQALAEIEELKAAIERGLTL